MNINNATLAVELDSIACYRRDGYLVVRSVLSPDHVEGCLSALAALAADPKLKPGQRGDDGAFIALEPGADRSVEAGARSDLIRKFGDFIDTDPALLRAAMSARLHVVLDALGEHSLQSSLVHHDDVMEVLTSNRRRPGSS